MESSGDTPQEAQAVLNTRKEVQVLDSTISYLDTAMGDHAVIFLHGNPTAAYLWRNIIPHVSPIARCLAPDLLGMGRSGKEPQNSYRFVDHYKYLATWMDGVNLPEKVTIVGHDWGSALGFHWCNLHRDRVQAIVFMEAIVDVLPTWGSISEKGETLKIMQTSAAEEQVLKNNLMASKLLPGGVLRTLSGTEMAEYLHPYQEAGESRRPTLTWAREIPVADEGPDDVIQVVQSYNSWLSGSSDVPKLFIDGDPGRLSPFNRKHTADWPSLEKTRVRGLHFLQEDSPHDIGKAIQEFLMKVYTNFLTTEYASCGETSK